MKKITIIRKI